VAPVLKSLSSVDTFSAFSKLCAYDDGIRKLGPEIHRDKVTKYLNFDGISTWEGLFVINKYTLDTLINGRLRLIMSKDDLSTEWSTLHRCYISLSMVKQWLTLVEGAFTDLPSSNLEMTNSIQRVNTARLSLSLHFTLPTFEEINNQNWLAIKDMLTYALTSRGLAFLLNDTKQDETFKLLDKLAGSALHLSLRDSNVSSLSYNEDRFSTMYSSLCTLFDNPDVRNMKATMVKELTIP